MADVVSPAVLQRLADRIEQLGKVEHVQIFRVLKVHGVKHTQNKNGCFMDISSAPPAAIAEVKSFVNYAAELDAERLAGTAGGKQPQLLPPSQHRPQPQMSPMSQLSPPLSQHRFMEHQSQAGAPSPSGASVDADVDAAGDAAFSVAPASVDGSLADDAADEDPGGAAVGGGPANGKGGGENRRKETSRFPQLRRKYSKQVNTKVNISDDLDVE